jgi:hypothetical protein
MAPVGTRPAVPATPRHASTPPAPRPTAPSGRRPDLWVPLLIVGGALATLAVGLGAKALGADWGAPAQPLLLFLRPALSTWAIPGIALLGAAAVLAPRLLDARVGPALLAPALFALTLATRLALNVVRGGPQALASVFAVHANGEGRTEYLPALPFLHGGVGPFLDHFAALVPRLPDQAAGHPPGFVLTLHALGITSAGGAAALAILGGALATPALYLLGRELCDERRARLAALLFVFVPTSLLYGATSADAVFATLGVLAAAGLLARRAAPRVGGALALAVASFFSWALLGAGVWAVLVRWRRAGFDSALRLGLLAAAVLVGFYAILYLATGFDPIAVVRATDSAYHAGIARLRPYLFWVFGSPAAFVLMLGPVAWLTARSLAAKEDTAVALALIVAISAFAGYTKAETERIWLFLVPFACLAAARALPTRWLRPMLLALCTQAVLVEIVFFTKW